MPLAVTSAGAAFANAFAPLFFDAFERNQLPDFLTRIGIRQLLQDKLEEERQANTAQQARLLAFVEELKASPIAVNTDDANEQHYEVPARFYEVVLGKCSRPPPHSALRRHAARAGDGAAGRGGGPHAAALRRAGAAGQARGQLPAAGHGLRLGLVALWFAGTTPTTVRGISNSFPPREWIMARAKERG